MFETLRVLDYWCKISFDLIYSVTDFINSLGAAHHGK